LDCKLNKNYIEDLPFTDEYKEIYERGLDYFSQSVSHDVAIKTLKQRTEFIFKDIKVDIDGGVYYSSGLAALGESYEWAPSELVYRKAGLEYISLVTIQRDDLTYVVSVRKQDTLDQTIYKGSCNFFKFIKKF